MKKSSLVLLLLPSLIAMLFLGCKGDISSSSDPILTLSTTSVTFAPPESLGAVSYTEIELSNSGTALVLITELTLVENDESSEVSLIDAEDWTSETLQLSAGETKTLRLQWAPTNAVSDRGEINITSNAGDYIVDFVTPDLDPAIRVLSENIGALDTTQGTLSLNPMFSGTLSSDRVQLKSSGLAPLEISKLCFIDSDDTCLSPVGEVGRGQLSLCQSIVDGECEPYNLTESFTLLSGEEHSVYLSYLPPPTEVDTVVGRLLIESDSADAPRYILRVEGNPCIECEMAGEMAGEMN